MCALSISSLRNPMRTAVSMAGWPAALTAHSMSPNVFRNETLSRRLLSGTLQISPQMIRTDLYDILTEFPNNRIARMLFRIPDDIFSRAFSAGTMTDFEQEKTAAFRQHLFGAVRAIRDLSNQQRNGLANLPDVALSLIRIEAKTSEALRIMGLDIYATALERISRVCRETSLAALAQAAGTMSYIEGFEVHSATPKEQQLLQGVFALLKESSRFMGMRKFCRPIFIYDKTGIYAGKLGGTNSSELIMKLFRPLTLTQCIEIIAHETRHAFQKDNIPAWSEFMDFEERNAASIDLMGALPVDVFDTHWDAHEALAELDAHAFGFAVFSQVATHLPGSDGAKWDTVKAEFIKHADAVDDLISQLLVWEEGVLLPAVAEPMRNDSFFKQTLSNVRKNFEDAIGELEAFLGEHDDPPDLLRALFGEMP